MEIDTGVIGKLILSPDQLKYFSSVFSKADPENTGKLQGRLAVSFLKTSGLPVDILKQIWRLTTPNQQSFLDQQRFCVALKLIALCQKGKKPSLQLLSQATDLPKFEGIQLPKLSEPFDISPQEVVNYKQGFAHLSGKVGYLNGQQTKQVMVRTQLPNDTLKQVYQLVDPGLTGVIKEGQFIVAMHILSRIMGQGIQPPVQVPQVLRTFLETVSDSSSSGEEEVVQQVNEFSPPKKPSLVIEQKYDSPSDSESSSSYSQSAMPQMPVNPPLSATNKKFVAEKNEIVDALHSMMENYNFEIEMYKEKNQMIEQNIIDMKEQNELILKELSNLMKNFKKPNQDGQIQILKQEISDLKAKLHLESQSKQKLIQAKLKLENEITDIKAGHQKEIEAFQTKFKKLQQESNAAKQKAYKTETKLQVSQPVSNPFDFEPPKASPVAKKENMFVNFGAPAQFQSNPMFANLGVPAQLESNPMFANFGAPPKSDQNPMFAAFGAPSQPSFSTESFSSDKQKQHPNLFQQFAPPKSELLDPFGQIQDSPQKKSSSSSSSSSSKPKENSGFNFNFFDMPSGQQKQDQF